MVDPPTGGLLSSCPPTGGSIPYEGTGYMKYSRLTLLVLILLAAAAAFFVYPAGIGNRWLAWKLGLDLIGGTHLVYDVDLSAVADSDRVSVVNGLRDVMERRVNIFGVSEPLVTTAKSGDTHRIIIELAGIRDVNEAINLIGRTALLEFREVPFDFTGGELAYASTSASGLTGRDFKRAQPSLNPTTFQSQIDVEFTAEGARLFEEITARNIGRPLPILLDGQMISAPIVQDKIIGGRAVISGQFSDQEAKNLASLLNAGALPAPVRLVSQQTIGASLGLDSLKKTLIAGLIGAGLVMLFMMGYYRWFGFFASLALVMYVIFTLAVFKGISMTMTLSGVAGFILSIGMAVDANVLIFERTKEEMKKGLARWSALEEGFRRAWPSIRDSNIATIITSLILYTFTSSFVKGFALSLLIGVLISMFSAITVTRSWLRVFMRNPRP